MEKVMQNTTESGNRSPRPDRVHVDSERVLKLVQDSLEDLRFGRVTFVVQDGVVVHVERMEKRRVV